MECANSPSSTRIHDSRSHRSLLTGRVSYFRQFRQVGTMAQRQTLPVLPLRGTVIFPGLTAPIAAGRPGTLRAIEAALKSERLVFAVAQRDNTDEPTPDILYSMGVIARIGQIQRGLGGVQLLLQGEQRATSLQYSTTEGYLTAVVMPVEEMKPANEDDPAFIALHKELRERAAELGERQREMYLREQMKAIQKELGDDDQSKEIAELRDKLNKLQLPREARQEVERELGRLERAGRESMEAQVIRTYLEWIAELPWSNRSDDNLDLQPATVLLDEDHYGLKDVKDRVLEFLAVRQLRAQQLAEEMTKTGELPVAKMKAAKNDATPQLITSDDDRTITDPKEAKSRAMAKGPILLFVGPPGVGKTSIAKSIARSLGREYVRVALGGARDEADI